MKYLSAIVLLAGLAACSEFATGGIGAGGTFIVSVGTEQFRVRIDNALLANKARRMLTGLEDQKIINGELATGDGGFNAGYHWHMKPTTITFADVTIELCDGKPSDVEADVDYWINTVKRYCPWDGRFVAEVGKF